MEHDPSARLDPAAAALDASRVSSFVDCLFEMPEEGVVKRASDAQRAATGRLEARLSAHLRGVIAARLRDDAA